MKERRLSTKYKNVEKGERVMKSKALFLIVGVFVGVVVATVFVSTGRATEVEADCHNELCVNPPCCNGDVNGDRVIDVTDVICLLNYLFSGGAEPIEIKGPPCDSCCLPSQILATGQTKCYSGGAVYRCDSADFPGQDGYYQLGCSMDLRFVDNEDGTVTDTCTGFMWQQSTADTNNDGEITEEDELHWPTALQYCDSLILCNDGTWTTDEAEAADHGGVKYDDWRLPNVRELLSIVDYGRNYPAVQPVFSTVLNCHWTSTTTLNQVNGAWLVCFGGGSSHGYNKAVGHSVRAVRGGL